MSYKINGKVYTSHPLMDEIVYNCKEILAGIVIKNDKLANENETENSLTFAEAYYIQHDRGYIPFEIFPFTKEILQAYGYSDRQIHGMLIERNNIPESDREDVTNFANSHFKQYFEEENDYYRMLIGLPPFNSNGEYDIYLADRYRSPSDYFPSDFDIPKDINFTNDPEQGVPTPLHKLPDNLISILYSTGGMDKLRKEYPGSKYSYMLYLGERKIDLYKARKAGKYDILYMPNVYYMVRNRFEEFYEINRTIAIDRSYQLGFTIGGEYYEQMNIVMLLCQTMNDMITDTPEWYIRRDIFDIRSAQYFLEANGVDFFKEIPLKYQIRIVKNLNKLIRYKSTSKNNKDILDIFSIKNTTIYKYYIYKKRLMDNNGRYIKSDKVEEQYDLEFISAEDGDSYDNYIKNLIYRTPYDDITLQDKYWDGEDDHEVIKNRILNQEFTISGTKYMSIEYHVPMGEYMYQLSYFDGLIFDSNTNINNIKIFIPSINGSTSFGLSDLFLFLVVLSGVYNNKTNTADMFAMQYPDINNPTVDLSDIDESAYDWKKIKDPELYENKTGRIFRFNSKLNKDKLIEFISRRHTNHQFGRTSDEGRSFDQKSYNDEYLAEDLKKLGITDFVVPSKDIDTIDKLMDTYDRNTKSYNILKEAIEKEASNYDEYKTWRYVFQELFTEEFDKEYYKLSNGKYADNLVDLLKDRSYLLYNIYKDITNETNFDSKQDMTRYVMNDIIDTLEYYLRDEGLEYIFSFTSLGSPEAIVKYIYLMINFFKSYKVHFLDPYSTSVVDSGMSYMGDGSAHAWDSMNEFRETSWKEDAQFTTDAIDITENTLGVDMTVGANTIDFEHYHPAQEVVDIYEYYDPDPTLDLDCDGMHADAPIIGYIDANGGVADDKMNYPYIVLDCGSAAPGVVNLWDINGGFAKEEKYQEYYDIDGGHAYHPDDERHDWFGDIGFTNSLDGGFASDRDFLNKSMKVRIRDNQIKSALRIVDDVKNQLVLRDDGLFMEDNFAKQSDFDSYSADIKQAFDKFATAYRGYMENLEVASNDAALIARIDKIITNTLANMNKVINAVENNAFENECKAHIQNEIQNNLHVEIGNCDIYKWGNFDKREEEV